MCNLQYFNLCLMIFMINLYRFCWSALRMSSIIWILYPTCETFPGQCCIADQQWPQWNGWASRSRIFHLQRSSAHKSGKGFVRDFYFEFFFSHWPKLPKTDFLQESRMFVTDTKIHVALGRRFAVRFPPMVIINDTLPSLREMRTKNQWNGLLINNFPRLPQTVEISN